MEILLVLALASCLYYLAYVVGPDDSRSKGITAREKSALSVAIGLGFTLPFLWQSYHLLLVLVPGCMLGSVLTATIAGRRPFLWALLAGSLVSVTHTLILRFTTGTHYTLFADLLFALTLALFVIVLPSLILYPVWEQSRRRIVEQDRQKARAAILKRAYQSVPQEHSAEQDTPLSTIAVQPEAAASNDAQQVQKRI